MADCPNCGRQALRTKDWACQWCGYPLVSRSFKVIDKTFKELQEERNLTLKSTGSEIKPELVPEYEPEPEPDMETPVRPVSTPLSEPTRPPQPQPSQIPPPKPAPPPQPQPSPMPPPAPEPALSESPPEPSVFRIRPEPIQRPVQPVAPPPPSHPQDEVTPEPAPIITPPPALKPEIIIEPEPIPEPTIKLEDIQDGMEITAEQIDALFRKGKDDANSALTNVTLNIKGIVEKVFVREHLDIRYIMLTGAQKKMNWSLRCTFTKEESSKLTRLQEGQEVVVQGKYEGYSKNIIFKDCVLV